ncbi:MAG: MCE family protein [Phycisphaerae bacterium]|nr:MCE family protein [Phycisphaerae bacterium]
MKDSLRNTLVGGFVLLSLVALGILMVWFGETPSFLRRSEWTLRITDVRSLSGIGEGSPVLLDGVEIGRVTSLDFQNPEKPGQGVYIAAGIKRQYVIPEGATARVYGAIMGFGTGHVEIILPEDGKSKPLRREDSPAIPGEMRSLIGELISKDTIDQVERAVRNIADLTESWTPVGTNLAELLEQRSVQDVNTKEGLTANLSTAVERIDRFVANLNRVLGDENVQDDVKTAVRDLKDSAERLHDLVEAWNTQTSRTAENLNTGIDDVRANLDKSFGQLTTVLDELSDSAEHLSNVTYGISQGKGTAGLLVRDDRLYEAAVLALNRFSDAMGSMYRLMSKFEQDGYVTVNLPSGFGKKIDIPGGAVSPPTGEQTAGK